MRKLLSGSVLLVTLVFSMQAWADLELPRPSPSAKVSQTIGLTEVSVEYSSPAVHGRKIWGGLLPYGELWRAGANQATKISFSKDATVGGIAVPAGSYALFVIPNKTSWTIVLNKDFNQGGTANYKKELDVGRFEVKPHPVPNRERLAYMFSDFTNGGGMLDLEWEKVRASIPIQVSTDAQAATNIKNAVDNAWMPYNNAARYMLEQKKDYDEGLKLVERSLAVREEWLNLWTKAQLLAAKGDKKAALPLAERAQQLGQKAERFFFAEDVKKALVEWKGK